MSNPISNSGGATPPPSVATKPRLMLESADLAKGGASTMPEAYVIAVAVIPPTHRPVPGYTPEGKRSGRGHIRIVIDADSRAALATAHPAEVAADLYDILFSELAGVEADGKTPKFLGVVVNQFATPEAKS